MFMDKIVMLHRKQESGEIQQVAVVNACTKGKINYEKLFKISA